MWKERQLGARPNKGMRRQLKRLSSSLVALSTKARSGRARMVLGSDFNALISLLGELAGALIGSGSGQANDQLGRSCVARLVLGLPAAAAAATQASSSLAQIWPSRVISSKWRPKLAPLNRAWEVDSAH